MKTTVVVNPQAQAGALGEAWPQIATTLEREIGPFDTAQTAGPGDATKLVVDALAQGAERIVAVGGDGTINEVVNGMLFEGATENSKVVLGLIPYGTGGDFRRSIPIANDVIAVTDAMATERQDAIFQALVDYLATEEGEALFELLYSWTDLIRADAATEASLIPIGDAIDQLGFSD